MGHIFLFFYWNLLHLHIYSLFYHLTYKLAGHCSTSLLTTTLISTTSSIPQMSTAWFSDFPDHKNLQLYNAVHPGLQHKKRLSSKALKDPVTIIAQQMAIKRAWLTVVGQATGYMNPLELCAPHWQSWHHYVFWIVPQGDTWGSAHPARSRLHGLSLMLNLVPWTGIKLRQNASLLLAQCCAQHSIRCMSQISDRLFPSLSVWLACHDLLPIPSVQFTEPPLGQCKGFTFSGCKISDFLQTTDMLIFSSSFDQLLMPIPLCTSFQLQRTSSLFCTGINTL